MLGKTLAIKVLNEGLSTGADYSEIYEDHSSSYSISNENGKIEQTISSTRNGVGIRLLKDNRTVYGYTNDLSQKGLMTLVSSLNKSLHKTLKLLWVIFSRILPIIM